MTRGMLQDWVGSRDYTQGADKSRNECLTYVSMFNCLICDCPSMVCLFYVLTKDCKT